MRSITQLGEAALDLERLLPEEGNYEHEMHKISIQPGAQITVSHSSQDVVQLKADHETDADSQT